MSEAPAMRHDQAHITPFWKKLPFFFLFPFRFGPLVFLCCLVAFGALAGMALGGFGLVFRGLLVYFGLRYAFHVLEMFAKGRFGGESRDRGLLGAETRPAKLGLVLALFLAGGVTLGDAALERRIARDPAAQEQLLALYRQAHAEELREFERDRQEWEQRQAARAAAKLAPPRPPQAHAAQDEPGDEELLTEAEDPAPRFHTSREDMVRIARPFFGEALWLQLQPAWFWVVVVLASLLLPSAAVVIALEDRFFAALNPRRTLHLMGAMGSAYFVLWGFFLAIVGARQYVLHLGQQWPAMFRLPAEIAIVTYLGLVLFALMGYALYQFHQELHLEVDVDFDEHRSAGDFREAIAEIKDRMRHDRHDVALNARLHALYGRLGDRDVLLAHGQQYLAALGRAGQGREALELLKKLQALDAGFQLQVGDAVLPAATAALQEGDAALAGALVRSFDKRFPRHKDIPGVFFLGARLLSEQNRQHAQAARILRAVLQNFPEHAVAGEARSYLQVLERMVVKDAAPA